MIAYFMDGQLHAAHNYLILPTMPSSAVAQGHVETGVTHESQGRPVVVPD